MAVLFVLLSLIKMKILKTDNKMNLRNALQTLSKWGKWILLKNIFYSKVVYN